MELLRSTVKSILIVLSVMHAVMACAQEPFKIAVLSFEGKTETIKKWAATAQRLTDQTGKTFEIVALTYDEINAAVKAQSVNFVFTNPEHYVVLRNEFGVSPMLTITPLAEGVPIQALGSTVFVRADNKTIFELDDVRGKRVAAVGKYSLGGFLAAADALRERHIDIQHGDVASLTFLGVPHDLVVRNVLEGHNDVGIVRTGVLERMALQGQLDLSSLRILERRPKGTFPQRLSSQLFPEWPFASMPHTDQALANEVAVTLLNTLPSSEAAKTGGYFGFTTPANYAPVEELMRRLRVYPSIEGQPLWKELWLVYYEEIELIAFLFTLAGSIAGMYFFVGNRRLREVTRLYKEAQSGLAVTAAAFESQMGIIVTDNATKIVRVNEAFTKIFGYSEHQLRGQSTKALRSESEPKGFLREIWEPLLSTGRWQGEITCKCKDGRLIPCVVAITSLRGGVSMDVTGFVGSFVDISDQKRAEKAARQLAFFDPLTELPNRRMLLDQLQRELDCAHEAHTMGALVFIDLDDFKELNDVYGHSMGDQLLRIMGQRLVGAAGMKAIAARMGGDEFVILCPPEQATEKAAATVALDLAKIVRQAILKPFQLVDDYAISPDRAILHYNISGSIGVATFGSNLEPVAEVLKRADVAMYLAKQAGKNTIRVYDPVVQGMLTERVGLGADLNKAIAFNQLQLVVQVQVTASGEPAGAECLLRWLHPERGFVSPAEFIPLAETSGAILAIGDWVIEQTCRTLSNWSLEPKLANLTLSANVSPRQFAEADFAERVEKRLLKTGANPRRLCLEITEGIVLQESDAAIEKMLRLKAIGVSFSVDDFGTGYSSLAYIHKLPLREIKIDKSFVINMHRDEASAAIAKAIIAMGESLQLEVLAEGVETEAQAKALVAMGCQRMQGYFFGRPMDISALESKLKSQDYCEQMG